MVAAPEDGHLVRDVPGDVPLVLLVDFLQPDCLLSLSYPYAIKNQRKARNVPSRGLWVA